MNTAIIILIVYVIILIFAISYLISAIVSLYDITKQNKKLQSDILNPLKKAIDLGNLRTIKDIYSVIKNSKIKTYSNNPDKYIEDILCALHTYILTGKSSSSKEYDDKLHLIDKLFKEFEKNNEVKPFEGLPDAERGVMLDIAALVNISSDNSTLLKSKLDILTKLLKTKEDSVQKIGADNKKSFRLSIVSLVIGIISMLVSIFSMLNDIFHFTAV